MKLMTLSIRNFKGISSYTLDLGGSSASVYGNNAAGKTSLYDAFLWLLFGKDSSGRADFSIKPIGMDMQGVDVQVEGTMLPDDGPAIALKRVYSEVWTRKRGDVAPVFTGHTTTYYVDGMPVNLGTYKAAVESLVPENVFRVLTNPLYFCTGMKWQERRKMLFDAFGGIEDADIAATDERFMSLLALCGRYTVDEYREAQKKLLRQANKELSLLPARIDEASRLIIEQDDPTPYDEEYMGNLKRIEALNAAMEKSDIGDLVRREGELTLEISSVRNAEQMRINSEYNRAMDEYRKAESEVRRQMDAAGMKEIEIERNGKMAEEARITHEMEILRSKYSQAASSQMDSSCPTCGRPYGPEDAEAFETAKQKYLDEINEKGIALRADRDRVSGEISMLTVKYNAARSLVEQYRATVASMKPPTVPDFSEDALALIAKLKEELREVQNQQIIASSPALEKNRQITDEIAAIRQRNKELIDLGRRCKTSQDARKRCEELMEQQQLVADEAGSYEEMIALCEEWSRVRASMVEASINRHFDLVTWRLYKEQINGGIEECCDALMNGVPYNDINGASKINSGLDIIGAFANVTGVSAPVFVDNAESVVDLFKPFGVQIIRLVVSENDEQLRLQK